MGVSVKRYRPVMFVGTGSGVGKSLLTAGLCRIFREDGLEPAPFKAQNMSLNSYVTPEGGEMGRAQALQAEACGLAPHVDMNPILLKPSGESRSQLILHGEARGDLSARDFFNGDRDFYFREAFSSFERLAVRHNPVVLEGAGSISELNLRDRDIVNMAMALKTGAAVYLVADIERGGIFGSVHGTLDLLRPEERRAIRGIVVNRFRGDRSLFDDGRQMLQQLAGVPVVGVIPHLSDLQLEEEDSLELQVRASKARPGFVNVAVVRHPRISNHSDFELLSRVPRIHLYYTDEPGQILEANLVVLPGSKNTMEDLSHLRDRGVDRAIAAAWNGGAHILGICGGYQMLGRSVHDPEGLESHQGTIDGLGILPLSTTLLAPKVTRQVQFRVGSSSIRHRGYEIHMGRSQVHGDLPSLFTLLNGGREEPEGICGERCYGTYIHGALDHPAVLEFLLNGLMGLDMQVSAEDWVSRRENSLKRLAAHLREHLDIAAIYREMGHA